MFKHIALSMVAVIAGLGAFLAGTHSAAAQGFGPYFWSGFTAEGKELRIYASPNPDGNWTVEGVHLDGATVKCARSTEELDLSAIDFQATGLIKTNPLTRFTIGRMSTDDAQVALVVTGQPTADNEIKATVTVYWAHLFYAGARDAMPIGERCSAVLPLVLQLLVID